MYLFSGECLANNIRMVITYRGDYDSSLRTLTGVHTLSYSINTSNCIATWMIGFAETMKTSSLVWSSYLKVFIRNGLSCTINSMVNIYIITVNMCNDRLKVVVFEVTLLFMNYRILVLSYCQVGNSLFFSCCSYG